MASAFTPNINLEEAALGDYVNSWNVPVNRDLSIIDQKFGTYTTITLSNADVTLTNVEAAYWGLSLVGALTADVMVILPAGVSGTWFVLNGTTGSYTVKIAGSGSDSGFILTAGSTQAIYSDGTSVRFPLNADLIEEALGFTPANVAGDTFTGPMVFSSTAAFDGVTTVPTVTTTDNSTNAASTALVANKITAQIANTPQVTVYTSGSGTYTTPAGATYITVEGLGGGGGGGGSGTGSPGLGTAGGSTTFGGLTAHGGPATPSNATFTYPTPATATGGDLNVAGALGGGTGTLNTGAGTAGFTPSGASSLYGGGGSGTSAEGIVVASSGTGYGAGGGGGGYGVNAGYNSGWGGNAGAYFKKLIPTPAATYSYSVGGAGANGIAGTNGAAGGNGSGGLIIVTAYFQ